MKRIYLLLALLPLFASCVVDDSDVRPLTAARLQEYSQSKLYNIVGMPVELLELCIKFDAYLSLPDEKKASDSLFFQHYKTEAENCYYMSVYDKAADSYIDLSVNTMAKSIWDASASWKIESFAYYGNDLPGVYAVDYYSPDGAELIMMNAADSTWALSLGEQVSTKMKMHPRTDDGLFSWTVEASGHEDGDNGMSSDYGTVKSMKVREFIREDGSRTSLYEGGFNVDIFRNGEPHDYCYMIFNFDQFSPIYKTSK